MGRMFQASVFFVAWWWVAWLCVCVWGGGGVRGQGWPGGYCCTELGEGGFSL